MKLCSFSIASALGEIRRIGVVLDAVIVDATSARTALLENSLAPEAAHRVGEAQIPPDMIKFIGSGAPALEWLAEAIDHVVAGGQEMTRQGMRIIHSGKDGIRLLAPIPRPPGIACFITWSAHIGDSRDRGFSMLKFPDRNSDLRAYYKANPDAVEAPGTTIRRPHYAPETDVECEMAAVIGVGGKDLSPEAAGAAIFGYTIFNDVSYREIQLKEMAFGLGPTKGKDADHSNVLGPWLVTADEVGDPQNLGMTFAVNGQTIGTCRTSEMAWSFADLASYLSKGQTLLPGQIVTSGAFPGGCGLDTNTHLKSGDVVAMSIDKLGTLVSTIG